MTGLVSVGFLHPGHWSACFGRSLQDLVLHDAFGEQRIVSHKFGEIGLEVGAAKIVDGRNDLARAVLNSESEWLFMVDSDMGFGAGTLEALIAAADPVERPVVGGLCFAMKSNGTGPFHARRYRCTPTVYRMWEQGDEVGFVPVFDYPRDQLVEVDGSGAACILIHRSVLEAIRAEHGDRWFDPIVVPKGPEGRTAFGEDLSFCLRVKSAGFPIFVHTGVKTTHDKGGVFLDEDTYDLQQSMICGE